MQTKQRSSCWRNPRGSHRSSIGVAQFGRVTTGAEVSTTIGIVVLALTGAAACCLILTTMVTPRTAWLVIAVFLGIPVLGGFSAELSRMKRSEPTTDDESAGPNLTSEPGVEPIEVCVLRLGGGGQGSSCSGPLIIQRRQV